MTDKLISRALHTFLTESAQAGLARRFFRLDGFDDAVYAALLTRLHNEGNTLSGQPLWVRTTASVPNYEAYALEPKKSATWYRNHVPPGYALVLIFNRHTSDAQSLKDVYPVTESLLASEGLEHLIRAAFTDYQPSPPQMDVLREFLSRLRRELFTPQLRDVAEFLAALNSHLYLEQSATLETAVSESLPYLGLFRCREAAVILNSPKGDALLRIVYRAARIGAELLDEAQRETYLDKLAEAEFDDEAAYHGLSPEQKRALLHRFLVDVVTDRQDSLAILGLDWREVAPILYKSRRKSRPEKMQELATALDAALDAQRIDPQSLPDPVQDALQDLSDGESPDDEGVERLLTDYGDSLPKSVCNQLRRLRSVKKYQTADFIAGVTTVGVEFLTALRDELPAEAALTVRYTGGMEADAKKIEALLTFRALHGGVETAMPHLHWDLAVLWASVQQYAASVDEVEAEGEREKIIKVALPFRVALVDADGVEIEAAELNWLYRSDGPGAATLLHLQAEASILPDVGTDEPLFQSLTPTLRIPIYNTCPTPDEVGDLDLSRPVASLGAWYRQTTEGPPGDLGALLRDALKRAARPATQVEIERALTCLEEMWARFVADAHNHGVLAADLDALLTAYDRLLAAAAEHFQQGQEVLHGFRLLVQAWMVGSEAFDEWAVVPFLHPLKLHWWRVRARRFDAFLVSLLNTTAPAAIVDVRRFRQELSITHGSAGYPAVLALPGKDRRPSYFLPVHEVDGYELFRQEQKAGLAYGLDPDLVSEDESQQAAQIAARELARVVQDYVETYPFVRDGLEIYLVECRNGALPGLLVEQLDKLARRRRWGLRLSVIVHSTNRGAPLYRRVGEWLKAHEAFSERPADNYFPPVTLRVLECDYEPLFQQVGETDLVILPDVLAEEGQTVEADLVDVQPTVSGEDSLPLYRAQQAPFERGEFTRTVLLTPPPHPRLLRNFYAVQWAAQRQKSIDSVSDVAFSQQISLLKWEDKLAELHRRFNWVVCYDTTVDRFLLEDTFPDSVEVIRYSLGLGIQRRHNLTVSSSYRARDIVESRLTANLEALLPGTPAEFRQQVAQHLVDQAKQVSGDIVLRAAGPGAYLNELIGMVVAKYETERRYLDEHPGALTAWIYLDDFAHWFDGRIPDLLFVAIPPEANGELPLHIEVVETKCVGEANFREEAADADVQMVQGVNRLGQAWAPAAAHLDAPYWYDQLSRAVVGNLALDQGQARLWQAFRHRLPQGDYQLEISGQSWVFCHDGSAGVIGLGDERPSGVNPADIVAPCTSHHFGRAGLRHLLRTLVERDWQLESPAETWAPIHDERPPQPERLQVLPPSPLTGQLPEAPEVSEEAASLEPLPVQETSADLQDWLEEKARELGRVLRDFSLRVYPVSPVEADIGPGVVRFKMRLRPGEKISRLQAIAVDLQRELALTTVPLIDNIRGTNFVGIDLPRPVPETLALLPALVELPSAPVGHLPFLVGRTPAGHTVTADLADLPHLLVAGSTGSGKTIFLYSLITSLLHHQSPETLSLLLIDPKQTDFVYFENLPHLLGDHVVIDPEDAIAWLEQLTTETLDSRTQQLRHAYSRDIRDYNTRHPTQPMLPIVVIIDEYADLVQVLDRGSRQDFERRLVRLAQRARNVGIHLVIATQRPSADIVTTSLKTNLPARVAFRLPSHHDSMTILDQSGAENLLGKGDMLFLREGQVERLQGFFVGTEQLITLVHGT